MNMKIGMVGCGKLGLMVALTIESKGHHVVGYDVNPNIEKYLENRKIPFREEHADELLNNTRMKMVDLIELVDTCDIIFMAVQTPHEPLYEGITRIPDTRVDFDYSFLKDSVIQINDCLNIIRKDRTIVIISTVLPGTIDKDIRSLMDTHFKLVYEPLFIAMGTTYRDYLNPEFVLIGADNVNDNESVYKLVEFYKTMGIEEPKIFRTDIRTAEAIKVFYNTFITMKTVLGNIYGEMACKLGCNVDDIYNAMNMATDRIISSKYLRAGMGDGGGCHPRDNIALSYIAHKYDLSFDIFDALMRARENHTEWLANLIVKKHREYPRLPIIILGKTFKPETDLVIGSPAILLSNILNEKFIRHLHYDPYVDSTDDANNVDKLGNRKAIYFIATKHDIFQKIKFEQGSIVIDPFRYIPDQDGVQITKIGIGKKG